MLKGSKKIKKMLEEGSYTDLKQLDIASIASSIL